MRDRYPSPGDIGLPEHITTWRPQQEELGLKLRRSTKRVKAACAPTGFGKTDTYVGDALLSKRPTAFVTDSRALQDQLLTRYASIGLVDLRGRDNYECQNRPDDEDYTCETGKSGNCPYIGTRECPADWAGLRAAGSFLVSTNYSKWIHQRKYGHGLDHIQRVVFDEGDRAAEALSKSLQVTLSGYEVNEILNLDFPPLHDAHFFSVWKSWAGMARIRADILRLQAKERLGPNPRSSHARHYLHLKHLVRKLAILATAALDNWIVEEMPKGFQFDVINPARYGEYALLLKVPEIIVVSATLHPKALYMIGVKQDDMDFWEFDSDFDAARCPIYYVPTMRVDRRATNFAALWLRHDQIAARRRDRNGLCHSVSYERALDLVAESRFHHSMFVNHKGDPPTSIIDDFINAYPGAILVSPSIVRGFDFALKAAEWQMIPKVPFPPPSKVLDARKALDGEYYNYVTMQPLVQAAGRIMRRKEDQGETFITDDNFLWFYRRASHLAPRSFRRFVKLAKVPPPPPGRLR